MPHLAIFRAKPTHSTFSLKNAIDNVAKAKAYYGTVVAAMAFSCYIMDGEPQRLYHEGGFGAYYPIGLWLDGRRHSKLFCYLCQWSCE